MIRLDENFESDFFPRYNYVKLFISGLVDNFEKYFHENSPQLATNSKPPKLHFHITIRCNFFFLLPFAFNVFFFHFVTMFAPKEILMNY